MDPKRQSSPQKQTVKNRSRSTDEIQQAKKAFHTPQKSLPGNRELDQLKVCKFIKNQKLKSLIPTSAQALFAVTPVCLTSP
uniref:Uncharacterized protein n=1 Tax=Erpetoichthys calabaricus TaxID=27687 RepID=A0A8C4XDA7_ERPCA